MRALGAVVVACALFSAGVVVGVREVFPYDQLVSLKNTFIDDDEQGAPAPSADGFPENPAVARVERQFSKQLPRLLRITSKADARATRRRVAAYLWGAPLRDGWGRRAVVSRDVARPAGTPDTADAVDRLAVRLPWGASSTAYLLTPAQPTRSLVIYHQGHEANMSGDELPTGPLDHFLQAGHAVLSMHMPLTGRNAAPVVPTPIARSRVGPLLLGGHNNLELLKGGRHNPMGLFFEPVRAMVDALSPRYGRIAMAGLSGGGWTTTVYAAIDPRISKSYPVAGTLPFSLLPGPGDWEQVESGLYFIAEYLDLYVLGAIGEGRSQLQILNERDPCCFLAKNHSLYEEGVAQRVRAIDPGRFEVRTYDHPDEHAVTDEVLGWITDDLR